MGLVETVLVDGKPSTTSIQLKGATKLDRFSAWYDLSQFPLLNGKTEYGATLDIYHDSSSKPLLQVYSDLVGVASTYPNPLKKQVDESRAFRFSMELSGAPQHLNFGLDNDINLSLEVAAGQSPRGKLILGEGVASQFRFESIEHAGFSIEGVLKEFDIEPWIDLMMNANVSNNPKNSESSGTHEAEAPAGSQKVLGIKKILDSWV